MHMEVLFSDDMLVPNSVPARGDQPLLFYAQGINIDDTTGLPVTGELPGPWRTAVGSFDPASPGLNTDGRNGVRWMLLHNRSMSTDVVVRSVKIFFR